MKEQLESIRQQALAALEDAATPAALEELREAAGQEGRAHRRPETDGQALR